MLKDKNRSGLFLILTGVLGVIFFWLTDPKYGPLGHDQSVGMDLIKAINDAAVGTYVGFAGCSIVVLTGLWLLTRRVT